MNLKKLIEKYNPKTIGIKFDFGISRYVFPNVYSGGPESKLLLNYYLKNYVSSATILDYGTGTGFLAKVVALRTDAKKIVATDINSLAIVCAKINFSKIRLFTSTKIDVRLGNAFNVINKQEKFDVIFASLPFHEGKPNNIYERSFYDENLKMRKELFENAKNHLFANGKILFTYSKRANKEIPLEPLLEKNDWMFEIKAKKKNFFSADIYYLYEIKNKIKYCNVV